MELRNKYHFYKKEISKLLRSFENISFYDDDEVLDRILNLLTEEKSVERIKGIIFTTEIVKYGGEITEIKSEEIYSRIIEWYNTKK